MYKNKNAIINAWEFFSKFLFFFLIHEKLFNQIHEYFLIIHQRKCMKSMETYISIEI